MAGENLNEVTYEGLAALVGGAMPGENLNELQYRAFSQIAEGGGVPASAPVTGTGATVTASTPLIDLSQTWNGSGVSFSALNVNITDTASAAASTLIDLKVGGASKFNVDKAGNINIPAEAALVIGSDVKLYRDHAAELSLRNGTTPQGFGIFNTYTDLDNFECGFFQWQSNIFVIGTAHGGTGSTRAMRILSENSLTLGSGTGQGIFFRVNGSSTSIVSINTTGIMASADAASDIGSSSARFRNAYFSGVVRTGTSTVASLPSASTSGAGARMAARLRRLYPLYILGLALGLGVVVLLHGWSPRLIMLSSIGAFFVPMFLTDPWLYPLNIASWSLACEFAINAAYGLIAPNLTGRRLGFAVAAGAAALAIAVPYHGSSNAGAEGKDILIGYARVLFGFPTGVLLYRLYRRGRLQWLAGAPPGLLVAAFVALALLPRLSPWLDLLTILAVLPALIAAGAQAAEPTGLERRSYAVLAAISYPLYVTHQPVLAAISGLIKTSVPSSGLVACCISAGLLIAVAAELLFDRPLRQRRKALAAAST